MTYAISGTASNLTNNYGEPYCNAIFSALCGLGNDLIDIGGFYWFAESSGEDTIDYIFWCFKIYL